MASRRGSPRFLEDRRAGLERYLHRLACHPAAAQSEVCARVLHRAQVWHCFSCRLAFTSTCTIGIHERPLCDRPHNRNDHPRC